MTFILIIATLHSMVAIVPAYRSEQACRAAGDRAVEQSVQRPDGTRHVTYACIPGPRR